MAKTSIPTASAPTAIPFAIVFNPSGMMIFLIFP
jgi:hypothetical protein